MATSRRSTSTATSTCCQTRSAAVSKPRRTPQNLECAEDLFRALSDRTRLRILNLLLLGETCVGDLANALQVPQPRASQQLASLRNAGLIVGRKEGQWTHYSLTPPASPLHKKLLECLRLCSAEDAELGEDTQRAAEVYRTGGCCP